MGGEDQHEEHRIGERDAAGVQNHCPAGRDGRFDLRSQGRQRLEVEFSARGDHRQRLGARAPGDGWRHEVSIVPRSPSRHESECQVESAQPLCSAASDRSFVAAHAPSAPRKDPSRFHVQSFELALLCGDPDRRSCCPWQCQRERKAVTVLPPAAQRMTAVVRARRLTMGQPKPPPEPIKSGVRMRGHRGLVSPTATSRRLQLHHDSGASSGNARAHPAPGPCRGRCLGVDEVGAARGAGARR